MQTTGTDSTKKRPSRLAFLGPHRYRPYELELRTRLLRATLFATAVVSLLYLLLAPAGVRLPQLYPWDGLGLLALTAVCGWLYRRRTERSIALAASWLVAAVNIVAAFNSQFYGIRHPVNALYLVGIILAGMLIGGWFLRLWTALGALFILGWGAAEVAGFNPAATTAGAVQTLPELTRIVAFWWLVMGLTGWLVWLFARNLERVLQVARGQTTALAHILDDLTADPTLDKILGQVVAAIAGQLQAQWASLFLLDEEASLLRFHLGYGDGQILRPDDDPSVDTPPPFPAGDSPIWQELVDTRAPIVVDDVSNDPRLKFRALILSQGIRTILFVPLLLGDEVRGYFSINSQEQRRFPQEEIELAQALAQQATLAWQLTELAAQAQATVVLEERNRMAREIHDTLAQGFTGIVIQLEAAEDTLPAAPEAKDHLARARQLARESLAEARRSVWALRPQGLDGGGLPAGLRRLASQLSSGETAVDVTVEGTPSPLPATVEDEALRIAQEAVNNALRHGRASHITLTLAFTPHHLSLTAADDGRGFDPDQVAAGLGLTGMRERAERAGGELTVNSAPGRGTTITFTRTWPESPRPGGDSP